MTDIEALLARLAGELLSAGARAVVLVGSHARGSATALSDVDLYALGVGSEYTLRREDGFLVSVSWRTPAAVRETFASASEAILAVPAWRRARILRDHGGEAHALQQEAINWSWERVPDIDRSCAEDLTGYAEDAQKLRWALQVGDLTSAAIWRNVIAMRMAAILAVHYRLLLDREEDTWPAVSERMGEPWRTTQVAALGIGVDFEHSCEAAISLARMTKMVIAPSMTDEQRAVVSVTFG